MTSHPRKCISLLSAQAAGSPAAEGDLSTPLITEGRLSDLSPCGFQVGSDPERCAGLTIETGNRRHNRERQKAQWPDDC